MENSKSVLQLLRYGFIGGSVNLMLYIGYLLINNIGLEPKKSMTFIYLIGVGIGFFGHRRWTFKHEGDNLKSMARFVLAHLIGYSINFLLLFSLVDQFGYSHQLVQGAAIFIVAAFLFVAFKFWVFPEQDNHAIK